MIPLPDPKNHTTILLEDAIRLRHATRQYNHDSTLTLLEISQLLWAAQGIISEEGAGTHHHHEHRASPSAGALYPIEIYLLIGNTIPHTGLLPGIYHYHPQGHCLFPHLPHSQSHHYHYPHHHKEEEKDAAEEKQQQQQHPGIDYRAALANAALHQEYIANAAISLIITAVYSRTEVKYGAKAERYVDIEVGHVGQNICLEATGLGLSCVTIGAFHEEEVKSLLQPIEGADPLYIIPIGR